METPCLSGMKMICDYADRIEATVLKWIRLHGFPVAKIGSTYKSDLEIIEEYKERRIVN